MNNLFDNPDFRTAWRQSVAAEKENHAKMMADEKLQERVKDVALEAMTRFMLIPGVKDISREPDKHGDGEIYLKITKQGLVEYSFYVSIPFLYIWLDMQNSEGDSGRVARHLDKLQRAIEG